VIFLNTHVARCHMYWCNFHRENDSSLRNSVVYEVNGSICVLSAEWRCTSLRFFVCISIGCLTTLTEASQWKGSCSRPSPLAVTRPVTDRCSQHVTPFYVFGFVHHNIFCEITNRCSYKQSILFHRFTLHVSGVLYTHHQEYNF
jgi:hypothetical protein